jgi:hypothetical protein
MNVVVNMAVAFLPLGLTEPIMNWLNPAMKRRSRVADYDPETFSASQWDKDTAKQKTVVLKAAQEERRTTGRISIELPVVERPAEKLSV